MWRFNPVTGLVTQLVLGFGIGSTVAGIVGSPTTLDFSRATNSSLIPALRRF